MCVFVVRVCVVDAQGVRTCRVLPRQTVAEKLCVLWAQGLDCSDKPHHTAAAKPLNFTLRHADLMVSQHLKLPVYIIGT